MDKTDYYVYVTSMTPNGSQMAIIKYLSDMDIEEFNIKQINERFQNVLWFNETTPYRILNDMISKNLLTKDSVNHTYKLTNHAKVLGMIEWL